MNNHPLDSIEVICTAAAKCNDTECPHAVAHGWYGELACGHYPCETYQKQKGIGKKRAECECVPTETRTDQVLRD